MVQAVPCFRPLGEQVVVVEFENEISVKVNQRVHAYIEAVNKARIRGIKLTIPTYNTAAVRYDPLLISYKDVVSALQTIVLEDKEQCEITESKTPTFHIPAVYGGEYGPDLENVADQTRLGVEDIVKLHSSKIYIVYMLGFTAGFPYCGDLDSRLTLPRLSTPHLKVRPGNIAIVQQQTIIHPISTPTGWHSIAWTPMECFNPCSRPPTLVRAGDYIKFELIDVCAAKEWSHERQREWNLKWNASR